MKKTSIETKLIKRVGKALKEFKMLEENDIIAVGMSGGKDSYALLDILSSRKKHIPIKYDIVAVHIDFGLSDEQPEKIQKFCDDREIKLYLRQEKLEIKENKDINCFYCSWVRRTHLFKFVHELKIKKLALGHHQNDLAETIFLNLFYQSKFESFLPNTQFFNGEFNLIRPLVYCKNDEILEYATSKNFPFGNHSCPFNLTTERNEVKDFLNYFDKKNNTVISNIFNAWIKNIKRPDYKNKGLVNYE